MADRKPLCIVRTKLSDVWEGPWQVVPCSVYVELVARACYEAPFGNIPLQNFEMMMTQGRVITHESQIDHWDENLKSLWRRHCEEPTQAPKAA